ncbi:MAG: DUF4857 domain-containing protein [Sulfurimonas sp.]|nr:DUF4857 domain-containing protein [Sulfurimonas sp.]
MIKSIIKKEYLKLKFYLFILLLLSFGTIAHFWYNLDFAFATIEPESMMWYRFAQLGSKPYYHLSYIFLLFAVVVSFSEFLPERIKFRIKIMAHLPLKMRDSLFLHLLVGSSFVTLFSLILACSIAIIMSSYYPHEIVLVAFKDTLAYSFAAIVFYVALSSVILEKNIKVLLFKALLMLLFVVLFVKERYFLQDSLWLAFLFVIPFVALDSFYSIKEQRVDSLAYKLSLALITISLVYLSYANYKEIYKKPFSHFYIFYSNIANDFVYQKNFTGHSFNYGIKGKKRFDRKTYETHLPFVYYKNLEIQNRLPIKIGNMIFDKEQIKFSRLGFNYHPALLKPQEVNLYPLLNPRKDEGVIKFSEEAFSIKNNSAVVYDYHNLKNKTLSNELTMKLNKKKFKYPALRVWGKSTNMKPFDKGYLVLDSQKKLFNISRADDIINVEEISYPKDIDIAYINISENKQKKLSGYAIDAKSRFYLLSWDFEFIPVVLEDFDYKTMRLKLISNPLNYLIRYDNQMSYYALALDKEYKSIKSTKLER